MASGSPSISDAYLSGDLRDLIPLLPADLETLTQTRWPQTDRAALAGALRLYHAHLGTLAEARPLIDRLGHPQARAVVTGQQAGLLTGPAYAVHKGASAARLARDLDQPDAPVVAVYWVASQDHDAEEVASVTLLDHAEHLHRLTLDLPTGQPVGRIAWQPGWTQQVMGLLSALETQPEYCEQVQSWFEEAVRPLSSGQAPSYADVFARLIHRLLIRAGVVVLDPLFPALAELMAPALRRELQDPLSGPAALEAAAATLEARGFPPQLRRPAGATNLFVEEAGQRTLLRYDPASQLFTAGQTYTREDLLGLLERDPSCLTPAAGLRPAVQDSLLPTLAFVVGPGEIGYLSQMRQVYQLHGLEMPLLWPRLSVTWLEPNVARLLRRLGATAAEVQRDPAGVLGRALARERGVAALSAGRIEALRAEWQATVQELGQLDPTLERSSQRLADRSLAGLARLQQRSAAALAHTEDTRTGQLTRLERHLLPLGHPQEREISFMNYLLKHGETPLRQLLELPAGFVGEVEIP
ncbi:bacillithiol biosynthesis cysteine-adding enzyme BshC [Deinococcus lacus]|uniref:Putative cysteine ligase BshC n=1 Tax=Deinococcus lacus TaxID=392561 RepID=A0ABW1YDM7_9DEIO